MNHSFSEYIECLQEAVTLMQEGQIEKAAFFLNETIQEMMKEQKNAV